MYVFCIKKCLLYLLQFLLYENFRNNLEFLEKRNKVFVFQGLYGQHFYNGRRLGACHKITGRRDESRPRSIPSQEVLLVL